MKSTVGVPLASKWKLGKAIKHFETIIDYQINEFGDVYLASLERTMNERRKRLHLENDPRGFDVVFSLDKGKGRVISTISMVHHPRSCSYYNHLPVQCWPGSDAHEALKQRDIG